MRKTRCRCRPTLQPLEERIALSFSFSGLIHSIFPFIPNNDKSSARKPIHLAPVTRKAVVTAHAQHLYAGPLGKAPANSTALDNPARKATVPMYGPYARAAAKAHPVAARAVRVKA